MVAAMVLGATAAVWLWPGVSDKAVRFVLSRRTVILSPDTGLYVGGIGIVLALEVMLLGWRASSLWRLLHPTRSGWTDLFLWGAKVLGLSGLLATLFSLGLVDLGLKALRGVTGGTTIGFANPVLQTLWLLVALDFIKYWMHVLQHKLPFWWEGHKFHHAASELNVITTARGHPTDHALQIVFLAVPAAVLGGTADQFLFLTLLLNVHAGLTHSMLAWHFGWIGRWVLVSPIGHRVHHSDLPTHVDHNFGAVFILWDRLFGTWYGGTVLNSAVNVSANPYNRSPLWRDLLDCPRRMLATLRGGAARQDRIVARSVVNPD
jgi:sterol desaturase/sphingolipid hydroxylase (fatty acid hydroxylase superfamily)